MECLVATSSVMMSQGLVQGMQQTPARGCAHCHATTSGRQPTPIFQARHFPAPRHAVGSQGSQRSYDCSKVGRGPGSVGAAGQTTYRPSFGILQDALRCGHGGSRGRPAAQAFTVNAGSSERTFSLHSTRFLLLWI